MTEDKPGPGATGLVVASMVSSSSEIFLGFSYRFSPSSKCSIGCNGQIAPNFLSELADKGLAYRILNGCILAISAWHAPQGGLPVGEHPLVCRLLRVIRVPVPPKPRYSCLGDVSVILRLLESWQDNENLSRSHCQTGYALVFDIM